MDRNLNGTKLLVLSGAAVHCKVVESAKEMGIYTIVTDYLLDSPAKEIANQAWGLNILDVDAIVERCRQEKVDGVLEFCVDPAQRPYQEICEKLYLPCYCTNEQVHTMTDKNLFKKFCVQHGVDVIPGYSEEDIKHDRVDYPVLIKPVQSRGSRGQTVCFSKKAAVHALSIAKSESNDGNAIIEKHMGGKQDFALSYLVVDGIPYKTKIGDRYLGNVKDHLDKQCISTISPSRYADKYIEEVEPRVAAMIASLGIKFGPVFLQGFIDGETVRFYDSGLRFPGGEFDLALRDITGFDTIKSLIHFALSGNVKHCVGNPIDAFRLNDYIVIQLTLSARSGIIATYEGFEEIAKLPYVNSVSKRSRAGKEIPDSGDVRQRVTEILIIAPDTMSAKATINDVYSKLRVFDKKGQNMLVSLLDVDLLDNY